METGRGRVDHHRRAIFARHQSRKLKSVLSQAHGPDIRHRFGGGATRGRTYSLQQCFILKFKFKLTFMSTACAGFRYRRALISFN